jgi:hypothetical protein
MIRLKDVKQIPEHLSSTMAVSLVAMILAGIALLVAVNRGSR